MNPEPLPTRRPPTEAELFVLPEGFVRQPGRYVCWNCLVDYADAPGRQGLSLPRFCRYRCRRDWYARRFEELGYPGCLSCRRADRHRDTCPVAIAERDDWICQLCRRAVDPSLVHPDPAAASLDHIVPRADGGRRLVANLRLAHVRCNELRGTLADAIWFARLAAGELDLPALAA